MISAELLTEYIEFARALSRSGPGTIWVMSSHDFERVEVVCERDVMSVMRRAGWGIYAKFLFGERI